jgi:gluconolactonase
VSTDLDARIRLERVADVDAHEGPVYLDTEDTLYVTCVPRGQGAGRSVAIKRLDVGLASPAPRFPLRADRITEVAVDTVVANGMTADADGRLVICEQGSLNRPAAISRFDPTTGRREVLVDAVEGLPLNSPNDVVVAPDGAIWFTDPSYGYLQGFRPPPRLPDRVYRYEPATGVAIPAADGLDKPNGIALSPDASILYVTDSGAIQAPGDYDPDRPCDVLACAVLDGGARLGPPRLFATVPSGFPDGILTDTRGRVYVSYDRGVLVFGADGDPLGRIDLPGAVNFTLGGPRRDVLLITADDAVWAAFLTPNDAPTGA